MPRLLVLLLAPSFGLLLAQTPDRSPSVLSSARTVTLRSEAISLSRALSELRRQTGVLVRDDRGEPEPTLTLDLAGATFWQAIERIATSAQSRVVVSPRDGSVSLARLAPAEKPLPTSLDGDFRVRVLRVTSTRDLTTDRGGLTFGLEVTWTPTLRPLFVDAQAHDLRILDAKGRSLPIEPEGSSLAPIDGRFRFALDVHAPGLPRSHAQVTLLEGKLLSVVPSRFLTFRFDADLVALESAVADGALRKLVQDDVTCRVDRLSLDKDRWSVRMALAYPPGGRILESYQASSLVIDNRLLLVHRDGKRILPAIGYVIDSVSSRRAQVTYHFVDRPGTKRGLARDWKLQYQAPARILEVPIKFRFRDLPLP